MMNLNQNKNDCDILIDLPYPPIQTECQQPEYAYAILSNIGSCNSEMSAVSLYFYNSIILNPEFANLAQCFHKISIVEMHHLQIFATLSFQMGLDPRLWSLKNRRSSYWTPACNNYPREICNVLENSIKAENAAIQKYSRQAELICDENIVEILNRIILDEQRHIEIFQTALDNLS